MTEHHPPRLSRGDVLTSGRVPLGISRYVLNGSHPAHSHDFVEVAVLTGGTGVHVTASGRQPAGAGDAFVLQPGSWHAYGECRELCVYNCCFGTELLRRELGWVLDDPQLGRLFEAWPLSLHRRGVVPLRLSDDALEAGRASLEALRGPAEERAGSGRAEQLGHLLLVLGALARAAGIDRTPPAPRPVHPAVVRAAGLLDADLARTWSLGALAREVSLDPSYLARLFTAGTGLPPVAYLHRARAERAAYLLLSTGESVSAIGAAVGWDDPNLFARRFRAHLGLSPSAYRASLASGRANRSC